MKAFLELYPESIESNIYIFFSKDEIEKLKDNVSGSIYLKKNKWIKSEFNFSINYSNESFMEDAILNSSENKYEIIINKIKFEELKNEGFCVGRIGSLHKYDIYEESKALKNNDLSYILRTIDFLNERMK
ncbi:MAG: hypothetical protein PHN56_03365 [Candidatus Nanoarchaeia archaeon]|nr:hypothetical protein [Candidatus Nanoarchaeia archaeon]